MRPFIFYTALVGACSLSAPAHANVGGPGIDFGHEVPRDVTFELARDPDYCRVFVYASARKGEQLIPLRAGEPVAVAGSEGGGTARVVAIPVAALAELNGAPPTWEWYLKKWRAGDPTIHAIRWSEDVSLRPQLPAYDRRRQLTARYRVELIGAGIRLTALEDDTSHWTGAAPCVGACFGSLALFGFGCWFLCRVLLKPRAKPEGTRRTKPKKEGDA